MADDSVAQVDGEKVKIIHTHIILLLKFWMVFVCIYVLILFKTLFFMRCVISRGRYSKVGKVLTQSAFL